MCIGSRLAAWAGASRLFHLLACPRACGAWLPRWCWSAGAPRRMSCARIVTVGRLCARHRTVDSRSPPGLLWVGWCPDLLPAGSCADYPHAWKAVPRELPPSDALEWALEDSKRPGRPKGPSHGRVGRQGVRRSRSQCTTRAGWNHAPVLTEMFGPLGDGRARSLTAPAGKGRRALSLRIATWLILPVVICLSQRLSHACVSMN